MKSSQLGEKIKLLQLENSPNGQSFSVEASELKARMRYLEGIQSEIKCKIIELQQENKKLWQEKEEAKSQRLPQLIARIAKTCSVDSLVKHGKQDDSGHPNCMVEKTSKSDDESLGEMEGIINTAHLLNREQQRVHESL
ncbi:hypothetical protein QUC31_007342 [Theobroma cacao]